MKGKLKSTFIKNGKKFLIVGIGINTNFDPKIRGFSSTSLRKIINKEIDNKKVFNIIKRKYEKFLLKVNKHSFSELKKIATIL